MRPHRVPTCISASPPGPHLHLCGAMAHDLAAHQLLPIRGGPHKVIRLITAQYTRSIVANTYSVQRGEREPHPIHFVLTRP